MNRIFALLFLLSLILCQPTASLATTAIERHTNDRARIGPQANLYSPTPVLVVHGDTKHLLAPLKVLSVRHDAISLEHLGEVDLQPYSIVLVDYGLDQSAMLSSSGSIEGVLKAWVSQGGTLIDFSQGEGFLLFDLDVEGVTWPHRVSWMADQHALFEVPYRLEDSISGLFAGARATGGGDLELFEPIAGVGGDPVILTREYGEGRILLCGIAPIGSTFKIGFLENLLYWASEGEVRREGFEVDVMETGRFYLVYPSFAEGSISRLSAHVDSAYELMRELAGQRPFESRKIVIDFTKDVEWEFGVSGCGLAGNPIYVCIWTLPEVAGDERVLYSTLFHELGHAFFARYEFLGGEFNEAFADLAKLYLLRKSGQLEFKEWYEQDEQHAFRALREYELEGCDFTELTRDVLLGMLLSLRDQYGWYFFKEYFSSVGRFLIYPKTGFDRMVGMFVNYLSIAADEDLRPRFIDWGFHLLENSITFSPEEVAVSQGSSLTLRGFTDPPMAVPVIIEYKSGGEEAWNHLVTVFSGDDGSFSLHWTAELAGFHHFRAFWRENSIHSPVSNEITALVGGANWREGFELYRANAALVLLANPGTFVLALIFLLYALRSLPPSGRQR